MDPIIEKIVITIVGIVVSGLATWLGTQIVKYKKLIKKEEDETVKNTIKSALTDELAPIRTDIGKMKTDISSLQHFETNFSTRLQPTQEEIEHLKDDITEILQQLKQQGIDLQNIHDKEANLEKETRCAWRYRIRQLCHVYIARGYMSYDEYCQLQEMYNIYAAIGGNGQTKELYERAINLEIKTDAEISAICAEERGHTCPIMRD